MFSRILICGSRDFEDHEFFRRAMQAWIGKHGYIDTVIEGCATGADSLAEDFVNRENNAGYPANITLLHFPAQWEHFEPGDPVRTRRDGRKYNPAAGPRRNQQMLDEGHPDAVIAFTRDLRSSRGTRDMVTRARRAGLPVWLPVAGSDDPTAK